MKESGRMNLSEGVNTINKGMSGWGKKGVREGVKN